MGCQLPVPGAAIVVVGAGPQALCLCALQLGPAAANIHGGREGARRITAALLHR